MPASANAVELAFSAKLEQFRKELAQMPGVGEKEAKKLVAAMDRQYRKNERNAAASAKKAAKDSNASWASMRTAAVGAATAAAAAVWHLTQRIADLRNDLLDMSARTGVSAKTLGGLRLAAEGAGAKLSDFEGGLSKLAQRMRDAEGGNKKMADAFAALGVQVTDTEGNLRSVDDVFREAVASLQATENPAERAALAVELFGRSGGKLAQALGNVPLDAFVDQAELLGTTVGPEAAASSAAWQRAVAELGQVFDGTVAKVIDLINLGPKVESFSLGFIFLRDLAVETFKDAGEALSTYASMWQNLLTLDFAGAKADYDELRRLGQENTKVALEGAQAFWKNRQAINAGGESSAELAKELGKISDNGEDAAGALKKVGDAARQLQGTYDALGAAEEKLLALQDEITKDQETQRQAIRETWAERHDALQAEIAGLQQIAADTQATSLQRQEAEWQLDYARQLMADNDARRKRDLDALDAEIQAAQMERQAELAAQRAQQHEDEIARIEERMAKVQEELDREAEAHQAAIQFTKEFALDAMGLVTDMWVDSARQEFEALRDRGKVSRKELLASWKAYKQAKRSQAIFDAAQAAIALIPSFAWMGPLAPLGAAGAVAPALTGSLIQIDKEKPPQFSGGGSVAGRMMSGDHAVIGARLDEGIVSPRGMALLGPQGLDAINRGEPVGGDIYLQLDGRTIAEGVERAGTSVLRPMAGRVSGRAPVYGRG